MCTRPGLPGLATARKGSALTQKQLAEKVGVTPEYLSYLENGRSTPSLGLVYSLASALGVSPSDLLQAELAQPVPAEGEQPQAEEQAR